jgi:hypothetical protein
MNVVELRLRTWFKLLREAAIDLHTLNGQIPQPGERGLSRAGIFEGEGHSKALDLKHPGQGGVQVAENGGLCDCEFHGEVDHTARTL